MNLDPSPQDPAAARQDRRHRPRGPQPWSKVPSGQDLRQLDDQGQETSGQVPGSTAAGGMVRIGGCAGLDRDLEPGF